MAKQDERFIKVLNESSTWTTNREIWVDKTTGVNYLWVASGYAGGLTPLLDANGWAVNNKANINIVFGAHLTQTPRRRRQGGA